MMPYATAVTVRMENQRRSIMNLVFAKTSLVPRSLSKRKPKEGITLPRLELLAVTIGV